MDIEEQVIPLSEINRLLEGYYNNARKQYQEAQENSAESDALASSQVLLLLANLKMDFVQTVLNNMVKSEPDLKPVDLLNTTGKSGIPAIDDFITMLKDAGFDVSAERVFRTEECDCPACAQDRANYNPDLH